MNWRFEVGREVLFKMSHKKKMPKRTGLHTRTFHALHVKPFRYGTGPNIVSKLFLVTLRGLVDYYKSAFATNDETYFTIATK